MFFSYFRLVWGDFLAKFKFKTNKNKKKFNFITDSDDFFNEEMTDSTHIEMFSNKKIILDGCKSIFDYQNDYIKLKLKKGYITVLGTDFLITDFENEKIIIKGKISSIEFCV